MSRQESLILVCVLVVLVGILIIARIRSDRRAHRWARVITRRVDQIEKDLTVAREECVHVGRVQDTRISIMERRIQAMEGPKPMETILDNDEED